MKKVAIVGSSRVKPEMVIPVRNEIEKVIMDLDHGSVIISGGAKGVDTIAVDVAKNWNVMTELFLPKEPLKEYFLERNRKIANECDELYCFALPLIRQKCYHHTPHADHEKTAGCYTMNKALDLKKKCTLVVVEC